MNIYSVPPTCVITHHEAPKGQTNKALRQVCSVDSPRETRKNQGCLHLRGTTITVTVTVTVMDNLLIKIRK
jgi:hypothetical protein